MIDSTTITLAGHDSQKVNFSTTASYAAGDYAISVNGLSGTLTVREPTPALPASKNTGTSTGRATNYNWWLISGINTAIIIIIIGVNISPQGRISLVDQVLNTT